MLESYLLVATLVLANGETLEADGDEYPTETMCLKENKEAMDKIRADIRSRPGIFKDMTFECVHLKVEFEGEKTDAD